MPPWTRYMIPPRRERINTPPQGGVMRKFTELMLFFLHFQPINHHPPLKILKIKFCNFFPHKFWGTTPQFSQNLGGPPPVFIKNAFFSPKITDNLPIAHNFLLRSQATHLSCLYKKKCTVIDPNCEYT